MAKCIPLLLFVAACVLEEPTPEPGGDPDSSVDDSKFDDVAPNETEEIEWSCEGVAGSEANPTGSYYITSFGCWIDEDGDLRGDGGDNCVPWCQSFADPDDYEELCPGMSGAECERSVAWYTADADRYGCLTRLRVTNPETKDAAVVVVLDRGPSCKIERRVEHWVLDLSYPASNYLFGGPASATERVEAIVEVVPPDTPLGPVVD